MIGEATCPHHGATIIDCGAAGYVCWQCEYLHDSKALWTFLGPDWTCPICDRRRNLCGQVVIHHDHFLDAVWRAVPQQIRLKLGGFCLETFQRAAICTACNNIDAEVKAEMHRLPKWFSLSPEQMRAVRKPDGSCDLHRVRDIWDEKRLGIFADKLRELVDVGMDREAIRSALFKFQPQDQTKREVAAEVPKLCRSEPEFRRRFNEVGHDRWLVSYLLGQAWPVPMLQSFVYFYHRRHRDPALENRPEEFGPRQFIDWLILAATDEKEAAAYRGRCGYWRRKEAAGAAS